jgi:predicted ATPase
MAGAAGAAVVGTAWGMNREGASIPAPRVAIARADEQQTTPLPRTGRDFAHQNTPEEEERLREALRAIQGRDPSGSPMPVGAGENSGRHSVEKPPVWRIVLTGGPCGGKSTAMHHLQERLTSLGFLVFVVPEAATLVITGGGMYKDYPSFSENQALCFEGAVMGTKMALEDTFHAIAEASGVPSVILCDRGTMDTKAYVSKQDFQLLMDEYEWNATQLRDRRYDAVIHLVTAAIGADKFYTTENNAARTETPQEAADLDFKVLNAWVGHPNMRIIDNSTDFHGKMKRTINQVCKVIGAPKPAAETRKFLISDSLPSLPLDVPFERISVEQTYLPKPKPREDHGFIFIRKRGQNGTFSYSHSMRREVDEKEDNDDVCVVERQISGREYVALLKQADQKRVGVAKDVRCFVHNSQYFELQTYLEPAPIAGLTVLVCESETVDEFIDVPDWLTVQREVTADASYSSHHLAKRYSGYAKPQAN